MLRYATTFRSRKPLFISFFERSAKYEVYSSTKMQFNNILMTSSYQDQASI